MAAWTKAIPKGRTLVVAVTPSAPQPTASFPATYVKRQLNLPSPRLSVPPMLRSGTMLGRLYLTGFLRELPWHISPISARLGLPIMATKTPKEASTIPSLMTQELFVHDDPTNLFSFGKLEGKAPLTGNTLLARTDGKHLHYHQVKALLKFLQDGPISDMMLNEGAKDHTKREAETIIARATPQAFEAFFKEYREAEMKMESAVEMESGPMPTRNGAGGMRRSEALARLGGLLC